MIIYEIFEKTKKKLANSGMEPRTVTLSHSKRSGPLYIPVENTICESQISEGQYEGWTQTIRTPFLHQTIRTFEILTSRKLSNQTQPDLAYPWAWY